MKVTLWIELRYMQFHTKTQERKIKMYDTPLNQKSEFIPDFVPSSLENIGNNEPEIKQPVSRKTGSFQEIEIIKISEPDWRPRKCNELQKLEDLTASVKQRGIIVPILIRPVDANVNEDVYELVAGGRRLKAARKAGLKAIPAMVRSLSNEEALQYALMENTLRTGLGILEETESIVNLLCQRLNMKETEVANLFHKIAKNPSNLENNDILQKWETVLGVFSALGKNWSSFRSNELPMLGWPDEVKTAVRMQQIAPSKARIISRIEDPNDRQQVLAKAIEDGATVKEVKTLRDEIEGRERKELCAKDLKTKLENTWAELKKSTVWDCADKKEKLAGYLRQINRLMQETDNATA